MRTTPRFFAGPPPEFTVGSVVDAVEVLVREH
jgi:hypothetical protein